MAVLAPQDWHLPREHTMDSPAQRQRSADHSPTPSPVPPANHYPYPVQQAQQSQPQIQQQQQQQQQQQPPPSSAPTQWNAQAPPFYPAAYYQNHQHQPPYNLMPHQAALQQQNAYFDHNAQMAAAQWYHQMMLSAQQQAQAQAVHVQQQHPPHLPHLQHPSHSASRSSRSPAAPSPTEYFQQNQLQNFSPFPSGTPPPPHPNGYRSSPSASPATGPQSPSTPAGQPSYDGFHPYRRPNHRQGSQHAEPPPQPAPVPQDWRPQPNFHPPYARNDASGSSSSVNSNSSGSRQRTSSLQGSQGGGGPAAGAGAGASASGSVRSRNGTTPHSPAPSSTGRGSPVPPSRPHARTASSSSSSSSRPAPASTVAAAPASTPVLRTPRLSPSPLSQGMTAADKRKSRDDSELIAASPNPNPELPKPSGIKGRLRRALSLSAAQTINEEASSSATGGTSGSMASGLTGAGDTGDAASTATKTTKKKSRTALFNSRLNASTDNISLSSTMSSASVVIRKLGSIGKLARRNSLAGITSLFKDKKEREDVEAEAAPAASSSKKDKGKKKKGEKGSIVEPSVSQINGEIDRQSSDWGDQLTGLSPAAELARRHTLKTNAAEAEAAKARVEETAAKARVEETAAVSGDPVPTTWEKNTTTRAGGHIPPGAAYRVNEEGVRVLVEDDDSGSEGHGETWDDEDWSRLEGVDEDDEEADVTIR
ncbi:hypothetical protein OF83DRAFT_155566, partial [Amylostereum chailletii]